MAPWLLPRVMLGAVEEWCSRLRELLPPPLPLWGPIGEDFAFFGLPWVG